MTMLQELDERLGAAVRAAGPGGRGVPVARLATHPGSWVTQVGIPAATAVAALRGGSRRVAVFAATSMLGTSAIFHTVKHLTKRERPHPDLHLVHTRDSSFPSGHAATSAAAARVCAELLGVPQVPLAAAAAFVGVTRVYLGVHHPSDVAGGFAIGWLWTSLMARLLRPRRDRGRPETAPEPPVDLTRRQQPAGLPAESWARVAAAKATAAGHPCLG